MAARAKDNFIDSWIQINDTPSSREQGIDIHEAHGATTHDLMQPVSDKTKLYFGM